MKRILVKAVTIPLVAVAAVVLATGALLAGVAAFLDSFTTQE